MPFNDSFIYDPMGIIILLIVLSLGPFVAMMITSFMKLVVVINLLRQAMGLQQVPPNMVVNGLALILTLYIMAPTLQEGIYRMVQSRDVLNQRKGNNTTFELPEAMKPYRKEQSNEANFLNNLVSGEESKTEQLKNQTEDLKAIFGYTKQPFVDFLMKHSTPKHRAFLIHVAKRLWPKSFVKDIKDSDLIICVPAFVLTELTAAFEIGFLIYLPFIAIDLIISNILLAMGMMMVSPMTISLPFKLMLFVLVNGWDKIVEALALTYR
ncbi:MAG: EscR/YscR/HrcR family type III secretion system export apparatus protein [Opitutales bacterium]